MNNYYLDELDEEQIETWLYKGAVAGLGDPWVRAPTETKEKSGIITCLPYIVCANAEKITFTADTLDDPA